MYRPVQNSGDTLPVPQLVFSRLTAAGADDGRFRVALYLLGAGGAEVADIATALGMSRPKVEAALHYWEGAGLIAAEAAAMPAAPVQKRRRMTTREVVRAGEADPVLGMLLQELQRVFGHVLGEGEVNAYVTLYVTDNYAADLILMAASQAAAHGSARAAYVEKVLLSWRRDGIEDCAAADRHLKQMAGREEQQRELAKRMGLVWDPFTLADKKKIAQWFEEYGYGWDMIEAARLAAGEKCNEVKYLAGVLRSWHGKGFASPKDVQQGDAGRNLRVTGGRVAPQEDVLMNQGSYVPLKKRARP